MEHGTEKVDMTQQVVKLVSLGNNQVFPISYGFVWK